MENWGAEPWRKPKLWDNDIELFSECGRSLNNTCYRSHWFVMTENYNSISIIVKHGGGEERLMVGYKSMLKQLIDAIGLMDSDTRYLTLHTMFDIHLEASRKASANTAEKYAQAFVDGRLKKRKKNNHIRVEILAKKD